MKFNTLQRIHFFSRMIVITRESKIIKSYLYHLHIFVRSSCRLWHRKYFRVIVFCLVFKFSYFTWRVFCFFNSLAEKFNVEWASRNALIIIIFCMFVLVFQFQTISVFDWVDSSGIVLSLLLTAAFFGSDEPASLPSPPSLLLLLLVLSVIVRFFALFDASVSIVDFALADQLNFTMTAVMLSQPVPSPVVSGARQWSKSWNFFSIFRF